MRNKYIIVTIFVFFCTFSTIQAQTEKGKFMIGANTSLDVSSIKVSTSSSSSSNQTTVNFEPRASYFLFDNFSAGLSFDISYQGSGYGEASLLSDFRYYFTGKKVRPFVKANIGYRNTQRQVYYPEMHYSFDLDGLTIGGGMGFAFFVSDNISIDLGAQYFHSDLDQVGKEYLNVYDQRVYSKAKLNDINMFVGLSMYF
ncbi:MAG: hypothetical protein VB024_09060 [Dysgonamonadaceae bacterium]|jgi:long-subunit fatty acid transport protein|nr:hypothetical protein [Dysgonamonadaceae bacterium]